MLIPLEPIMDDGVRVGLPGCDLFGRLSDFGRWEAHGNPLPIHCLQPDNPVLHGSLATQTGVAETAHRSKGSSDSVSFGGDAADDGRLPTVGTVSESHEKLQLAFEFVDSGLIGFVQ